MTKGRKSPDLFGQTQGIVLELLVMGRKCAPENLDYDARHRFCLAFASEAIAVHAPRTLRQQLEDKFGSMFTINDEPAHGDATALATKLDTLELKPEERAAIEKQLAATETYLQSFVTQQPRVHNTSAETWEEMLRPFTDYNPPRSK